jgi:8-oxo-dGTP pyrophosphatase MutT (NUDIX family)
MMANHNSHFEVAFPGGRQEKEEGEEAAAIRETAEEVGIHLDNKDQFMKLGRLSDWWIPHINRLMIISPFVYLQVTTEEVPLKVQQSEVADAGWVDVSPLLVHHPLSFYVLERPTFDSFRAWPWLGRILIILGVQETGWPCLLLPFPFSRSRRSLSETSERKTTQKQDSSERYAYLWGLTLGWTLELNFIAGYPVAMSKTLIPKKSITTTTPTLTSDKTTFHPCAREELPGQKDFPDLMQIRNFSQTPRLNTSFQFLNYITAVLVYWLGVYKHRTAHRQRINRLLNLTSTIIVLVLVAFGAVKSRTRSAIQYNPNKIAKL